MAKILINIVLYAVSDILKIAIKKTTNVNNTAVIIFTDSSAVMINIKKIVAKPKRQVVRDFIYQKANKLLMSRQSIIL